MALNTSKYNHLPPLPFKGLNVDRRTTRRDHYHRSLKWLTHTHTYTAVILLWQTNKQQTDTAIRPRIHALTVYTILNSPQDLPNHCRKMYQTVARLHFRQFTHHIYFSDNDYQITRDYRVEVASFSGKFRHEPVNFTTFYISTCHTRKTVRIYWLTGSDTHTFTDLYLPNYRIKVTRFCEAIELIVDNYIWI